MIKKTDKKQEKQFEEVLLEVRKVTRVTTGWRQMSFRATILVGNKKWKIGIGSAKWWDVLWALKKATHDAYKNIATAYITENGSVPYSKVVKYKSATLKLIPATTGTWLKAWSSVRRVLELAGYTNILSKIVWTNNKLNNAKAAINAISTFKK